MTQPHAALRLRNRADDVRGAWQLDLASTQGGEIRLDADDALRVKLHVGEPVSGTCGAHQFVYQRGDVDLIPAGMSDVWREDGPSRSLLLRVSPLLLRRAADELGRSFDPRALAPRHQLRDARIVHVMGALAEQADSPHPGDTLYAESLSLALAAHVLGAYGVTASSRPRGLTPRQQHSVLDYIEQHLDRDLSLTRLAQVAGLSGSHLKTQFKRSMGVPVHEYVVQRRVERARQLLSRGTLPVGQVALEAGFAHQSHLARCMKRVLGITPSALRGR